MIKYLQECQDFYDEELKKDYGVPKGCSEVEISDFELRHGISLPLAYRQYLRWMGQDFNGVFKGSEWFLRDVDDNTSCLDEFLDENEICFEHLGSPVCFFSHQGYMSAWFYVPAKDEDPVCCCYSESSTSDQVEIVGKFSMYLLHELHAIKSVEFHKELR